MPTRAVPSKPRATGSVRPDFAFHDQRDPIGQIVAGAALNLIALGATTVFFVASRRMPLLTQRPVLSGAVFGIGVYLVMTFIVLPLSAYPHPLRFTPTVVTANLIAHMTLFGQPIAWAVSRVPESASPGMNADR